MAGNRRLGYTGVALLKALQSGHRYGLDMMEATGLASGTVYPMLGRLEKRGLVRARWERRALANADARPRRRYYELTSAGEAALREALDDLRALASEPGDGAVATEKA